MLQDTFSYAARNLTTRRLRSWLTILGILIGIAAVVSLISLGQGLQTAITEEFSGLGTNRLTIQAAGGGFGPPGAGAAAMITESDRRVVERSQGVIGAGGRIIRPATVEYNRQTRTYFLASLPLDRDQRAIIDSFQELETQEGRLLTANDRNRVVLGSSFANPERFGRAVEVGRSISIEGRDFQIIGILKQRGTPQSDQAILMNEPDVREILNMPEEYSIIIAQTSNAEEVPFAKEAIEKDLRSHRGVSEREEDFTVSSAEDVLATFTNILGVITGVLVGIAAISLLVGGIGIMTTMYTAVIQRKREIGIMKAVGATNQQVQNIFLIESGLLGMVGGIIGVLIGAGFAKTVQLLASIALGPSVLVATTPLWLILGSLAFSFLVGTLSGVLPARQAAKLPPVEALR